MLAAAYIAAWIFYLARQYDQTISRDLVLQHRLVAAGAADQHICWNC